MTDAIRNLVTVITGASSGIGRATALAIARHGGTVVVAARRAAALESLAQECEAVGGNALPIPTDVSNEYAVQTLANRTAERYGRIDVWINNAAVTMFGRFEEVPSSDYHRVLETNLFGYIYGARAVLPWFREQGSGVLINVSSAVGKIGQPFTSAYVVSKFGIVGLSESLRQELTDAPGIHVVTVLPPSVDTPLFQQGANYTGRAVQPVKPVHDPYEVADAIVGAVISPQREVIVGGATRAALFAQHVAPALVERLTARVVERRHFQDRPAKPSTGNLYEPMAQYAQVRGGWQRPRLRLRALITVAGLAGIALGMGVGRWRMHRTET